MIFEKISIADPTVGSTVDYKFNDDETWMIAPYPRVITGVAFGDADAIGDAELEIYAGNRKIANFFNCTTDAGSLMSGDPSVVGGYKRTFLYVPRGTPLVVQVDSGADTTDTAAMKLGLIMQRVPPTRGYIGGSHWSVRKGAVTAVDFAEDEPWNMTNYPRIIRDIGVSGSAAVGQFSVVLNAGNVELAEVYNTVPVGSNTANITAPEGMKPVNAYLPANRMLEAEMKQASTTNYPYFEIDFVPAGVISGQGSARARAPRRRAWNQGYRRGFNRRY